MAILPAVGAVAGAVGTVAQMGAAGRSARNQRAALDEQNRQLTEQHKLLLIQREAQRKVSAAEASRARQVEDLAASANLFNVALQEQSMVSQGIAEQLDLRAQQFQVEQQEIATLTEAYGQEIGTFNQLFDMARQGQAEQGEIGKASREVEAAAASTGQTDTASSQALAERISLDSQNAFQMANQLFEMLQAQSEQNISTTTDLASLQRQLGMSDVEIAKMMGEFNRNAGLMQLSAQRDATLLEQQMNNAAIDEEVAARNYAIESATQADSMNIQGAQRLNSIQRQGSRGPGLFEMLPGLTQAGLGVYGAFNQPVALPARVTNPLYTGTTVSNPASSLQGLGFSGRSLGNLPRYGQGTSMSGNVPSLFNIG